MLSDAMLPDRKGPRLKGLRLELPLDRMVKFVAVGFPLLLMSLAFAQEFSSGALQYSCLENPQDRETWWAMVHGVTKSQTCLK